MDYLEFIGDAAFSGNGQAEVRATPQGYDTEFLVAVDNDGDGFVEFFFDVSVAEGQGPLTGADFIFG